MRDPTTILGKVEEGSSQSLLGKAVAANHKKGGKMVRPHNFNELNDAGFEIVKAWPYGRSGTQMNRDAKLITILAQVRTLGGDTGHRVLPRL